MGINEYIKIGKKIKNARLAAKISQKDMAEKLGISPSTYSNYENGYREPPMEIIKEICDYLGTDLSYLILGDSFNTTQDCEILFDNNEFTEEELEEIKKYAEFIKSKRNKG